MSFAARITFSGVARVGRGRIPAVPAVGGMVRREVGGGGIKVWEGHVGCGGGYRSTFRNCRDRQIRLQSSSASSHSSQSSSDAPPSQSPQPPPQRPFYIRAPIFLALTLLTFSAAFIMAGAPALESLRDIANPPTDAETLKIYKPSTEELAAIELSIFSHPLTRSLLQDEKYIASRPHLKIPEALRAQNLTGGTLLGPDKIAVPPLQFTTEDGSSFVSIQYLGTALCGHPGIVHGGLLATLLDEGLARCCFPALPNKVAVTASLKIDYRAPAMAGQIVVLKAETTKVEGRKAWVKGRLETLPKPEEWETGKRDGVVLTEGEALFIEPRQAAQMRRVVPA